MATLMIYQKTELFFIWPRPKQNFADVSRETSAIL